VPARLWPDGRRRDLSASRLSGDEENVTAPRKHILHLTPLAACGGCEVNCLRIIQALDNCDHLVLVFGEAGPMTPVWESASVRVLHLAAWDKGLGYFSTQLGKWAEGQAAPDAVMYWSSSRIASVLSTLGKWDVPWTVYLGNPLPAGSLSGIRRSIDGWMQVPKPNVTLVACSQHVAASHREASYFRGFATEVIYNAVDPSFDRPHAHRPLEAESAPVIGMVARLDQIKDHKTLLGAVAALAPVRPDILLEFAGDGPLRQELENEARRLKIADRVRFLGFRPVVPLLEKWDIYVHSTTASEGMGTAVAEAMMSGLPCIVSDLDVMREVCGRDGALFAPAGNVPGFARALLQLIQDRALREAIGGAARSRARLMFGSSEIGTAYARLVFPSIPIRRGVLSS
jgi:glycosyltransferase involved in cell wall biosynthesis